VRTQTCPVFVGRRESAGIRATSSVLVANMPIAHYAVGDAMAEAHAMVSLIDQGWADQIEAALVRPAAVDEPGRHSPTGCGPKPVRIGVAATPTTKRAQSCSRRSPTLATSQSPPPSCAARLPCSAHHTGWVVAPSSTRWRRGFRYPAARSLRRRGLKSGQFSRRVCQEVWNPR
jgi:hypothetical protein